MVEALGDTDDLAGDLGRFARQHIVDVTQPHLLRLRRIVIAEADRFPDLAAHLVRGGPRAGPHHPRPPVRGPRRAGAS